MKKATKRIPFLAVIIGLMMGLAVFTFTGCSACNNTSTSEQVKITMSKTSATIKIGETLMLSVKVTPEDVTDKAITWKSDNEQIATVANGMVQGIGEGTAIITATSNDRSATCKVTVTKATNNSGNLNSTNTSSITSTSMLVSSSINSIVPSPTPSAPNSNITSIITSTSITDSVGTSVSTSMSGDNSAVISTSVTTRKNR